MDEGRVVTAGGVASSLDLGLSLLEKYWGPAARQKVTARMEYRAYSPLWTGHALRECGGLLRQAREPHVAVIPVLIEIDEEPYPTGVL